MWVLTQKVPDIREHLVNLENGTAIVVHEPENGMQWHMKWHIQFGPAAAHCRILAASYESEDAAYQALHSLAAKISAINLTTHPFNLGIEEVK